MSTSILVDLNSIKEFILLGIWCGFFMGLIVTAVVLFVVDGLAGAAQKMAHRGALPERAS